MGQQGESLPNDAFVLRLVHPKHFDGGAPRGARVQTSALMTSEFKPPKRPSLWVEADASLDEIVAAEPGFADRGVVRVQVVALRSQGFDVEYSPDECTIEALKHAHASLLGVTKDNRNDLVEFLDEFLIKEPPGA